MISTQWRTGGWSRSARRSLLGAAIRLRGLSVVATTTVLLLATGCGERPEELLPPAELPFIEARALAPTYPVERADLSVEVEGTAVVAPIRSTELYFTEGGRLTDLPVEPGSEVTRGAVLAKLESSAIEHQLDLARVDLEIDRLQSAAAAVSTPMQQQIRALQLAKRESIVAYLEGQVAASTIRAPYEGVVTRVLAEVGELVSEYSTVIEIADPRELELQMRVSVDDFNRIRPGLPGAIETAPDAWTAAKVVDTALSRSNPGGAIRRDEYVIHLRLTEGDTPLRVGRRHQTRVVIEHRPGTIIVPRAALREFRDRTYVRVLEGDLRREVDVRVGMRSATQVEILEGLLPGQLVIGK